MANLIQYNGDSKVIKRICELLNTAMSPVQDVKVNGESVLNEDGVAEIAMLILGEDEDNAYPGNLGKEAHDHSLVTSGNPHHVTAEDLGLGNIVDQVNAILSALGLSWNWITHEDEYITDHNGDRIIFHGVGLEETQNIQWH